MHRHPRRTKCIIEPLESRTLFSLTVISVPTDLGDLTGRQVSKTAATANGAGLPDAYTFTTTGSEIISLSTVAPRHTTVSLHLANSSGQNSFNNNPRSVNGVIAAGTYTVFASAPAGSQYELVARTIPTKATALLFPSSGQQIPGGWTYSVTEQTNDPVTPIASGAKVAATVGSEDVYSFTLFSSGIATATLQSPAGSNLSLKFFDGSGPMGNSVGDNPIHFSESVAGTYYIAVINQSAISLPSAYHLKLAFKSTGLASNTLTATSPPTSAATLTPWSFYQAGSGSVGTSSNASSQSTSTAAFSFDGYEANPTIPGGVSIKFTYYGDADLDTGDTGSDYASIDNAFNGSVGNSSTVWTGGDFNYDGKIDGSDYALINNAFNTQDSPISTTPEAPAALSTSILTNNGMGWYLPPGTGSAAVWTFSSDGSGVIKSSTIQGTMTSSFRWQLGNNNSVSVTMSDGTVETLAASSDFTHLAIQSAAGTSLGTLTQLS